MNIRPRTYNEALRLQRCLSLRNYCLGITDETILRVYQFLNENPTGKVTVSGGRLCMWAEGGPGIAEPVLAIPVETPTVGSGSYFELLTLTALTLNVTRPYTRSSGGDSGSSGNNNNNNNNNNNG